MKELMRKNILYVVTKLELGGAQKQALSLARCLNKEEYNIFLFTAYTGLLMDEALAISGITIKRSRFLERSISPLKDLLALFEIYSFKKKKQIDNVHTDSSKAGIDGRLAARLAKVKINAYTVTGWSFNDYQPFFMRLLYIWLERWIGGFTNKLIVVSFSDREKGLSNNIAREDKYSLIRYGIDYAEFSKKQNAGEARQELGIGADDLVVGMIACFKPQKSPGDFVRLAGLINQSLPRVKFILVGDGVLRENIEDLISQYNLQKNMFLLGWREDIPSILSAIDVFVLTSLWEGLPISVLEAFVSYKPVVATDTGGVREVVFENKTGFLVPPGDIKAMAEKVKILLNDKNLRLKMGDNAHSSLGVSYRLDYMVNSTKELYENLFTHEMSLTDTPEVQLSAPRE